MCVCVYYIQLCYVWLVKYIKFYFQSESNRIISSKLLSIISDNR